jgi:hypothetical protein
LRIYRYWPVGEYRIYLNLNPRRLTQHYWSIAISSSSVAPLSIIRLDGVFVLVAQLEITAAYFGQYPDLRWPTDAAGGALFAAANAARRERAHSHQGIGMGNRDSHGLEASWGAKGIQILQTSH